jgi:hypothetical protein
MVQLHNKEKMELQDARRDGKQNSCQAPPIRVCSFSQTHSDSLELLAKLPTKKVFTSSLPPDTQRLTQRWMPGKQL